MGLLLPLPAEAQSGVEGQLYGELPVSGEVGGEVPHQLLQPVEHRPVVVGDVVVEQDRGPVEDVDGGGVEHGGLGREVVEERALADPQALRDVLHPGGLEALGPEQLQRHAEDGGPLLLFLLLPQAHGPPEPRWPSRNSLVRPQL